MPTLNTSQLKPWLRVHCEANVPTLVLGGPGTSKTEQHEQLAMALGRPILKVHLSRHSPTDIAGFQIPDFTTRTTVPTKPHIIEACWKLYEDSGAPPILFLDELLNITPATLVSVRQLILEGRVDIFELPPGTWRCAAANNTQDRAHTLVLDPPTANRMSHASVVPNLDDWIRDYALREGIDDRIIGFLRWRPNLLYSFDPALHGEGNYAFCTLRSWVLADRLIKAVGRNPDYHILSGVLGAGPAAEVVAFSQTFSELPAPDDIFKRPQAARIPNSTSALYAVCAAISVHYKNVKQFPAIMTYLKRMDRPDFSVFVIKDIAHKDGAVFNTPQYQEWLVEHSGLMLDEASA